MIKARVHRVKVAGKEALCAFVRLCIGLALCPFAESLTFTHSHCMLVCELKLVRAGSKNDFHIGVGVRQGKQGNTIICFEKGGNFENEKIG